MVRPNRNHITYPDVYFKAIILNVQNIQTYERVQRTIQQTPMYPSSSLRNNSARKQFESPSDHLSLIPQPGVTHILNLVLIIPIHVFIFLSLTYVSQNKTYCVVLHIISMIIKHTNPSVTSFFSQHPGWALFVLISVALVYVTFQNQAAERICTKINCTWKRMDILCSQSLPQPSTQTYFSLYWQIFVLRKVP